MECPYCHAMLTEITVVHNYSIDFSKEQGKWVKQLGEATYSCSNCESIMSTHDIEDVLIQVDEL